MNFDRLDQYLKQFVEHRNDLPGCDVIIQRGHRVLHRAQFGFSNLEKQLPVRGDELYCLYSCTKPITVVGAMRLVEQGLLDLDAPVSRYLPFFSEAYLQNGDTRKRPEHEITVRHLFTMTAGFTYNMSTAPIKALFAQNTVGERISTISFAKAALASPLAFEPGDRYYYSICLDLLGAVVEAVSDMPFGEYQKKNIFDPLGMSRTGFIGLLSDHEVPAPVYLYDTAKKEAHLHTAIYEFGLDPHFESGGAGLLSTVEDYAKFAATMAHSGLSADGYRLLRPETIRQMTTEQLTSLTKNPHFECAAGPGYGYGLGVRTLIRHDCGQRSPLGEFGWDGAAGSYVMMDMTHDLSIFFATHLRGWHSGFGSIHAPIRDMTYDILGIETV